MNILHEKLSDIFSRYPDKKAVITDRDYITYRDLYEHVKEFAMLLRDRGFTAKDRVAIQALNTVSFIAVYLACLKENICVIPIDPRFTHDEINEIFLECGPKASILFKDNGQFFDYIQSNHALTVSEDFFFERFRAVLFELSTESETRFLADDFVIHYSSGSTGKPKGIILSFDNIFHKVSNWNHTIKSTPDDIYLCTLTLSHCFGLYVHTLSSLMSGATVVIPDIHTVTPRRIAKLIRDHSVTIFGTLPYMYSLLTKLPNEDLSLDSVRYLISGSAPLSETTAFEFREKFGCSLNQVYGLTEIGLVCFNTDEAKPLSLGKLTSGMRAKVLDENGHECDDGVPGELVVTCGSLSRGYVNNDEEQKDMFIDNWLHTKDIVVREGEIFRICGRLNHMINVGGNKVSPTEIEDILLTHPSVESAAIIGQRSGDMERIVAFVISFDKSRNLESDLINHCRERMSAFKIPKEIRICSSFPTSSIGKILKSKLYDTL